MGKFKGDSKFSTWIYRVAYNTCLDQIKKNKKHEGNINIDDFSGNMAKTMENALGQMMEEERKKTIQHCLNLLPGEEGFLLTLFYFEEQTLEEIGKIMNITANNVKVRLYRSRQKLAAILKEKLEPEIIDYYERKR
ncbi:MAG TPA: sigma-70 family RNA polymerase sigma factor [Flavobacterium sp.]|nr:sigma-70 family RNA polymerase sigma factor [Flavobacterium sp.]